jgi:hypothetical protein
MGAIAVGGSIAQLATLVVVGLLALQAALGVATLLIPHRLPAHYRAAGFRLGPVSLPFFSVGLIGLSGAFLVIAASSDPNVVLIAVAWLVVGVVYYGLRRSALTRRGVDVAQLIRDHVEEHVPRDG